MPSFKPVGNRRVPYRWRNANNANKSDGIWTWASFLLMGKIKILVLIEHAVKVLLEWLFFTIIFQLWIHFHLGGTKPAVCYGGWKQVKECIWKPKFCHVEDSTLLCKCSLNGLDKPRETFHCQVRTDFPAYCQHGMHLKKTTHCTPECQP